jgi:hypothetical protein
MCARCLITSRRLIKRPTQLTKAPLTTGLFHVLHAVALSAEATAGNGVPPPLPTGRIRRFSPFTFPTMNQLVNSYRLVLVASCTLLLSACGKTGTTDTESQVNPANSSISSGDSGTGGATGALADSSATAGSTAGSTPANTGNASGNTNANNVGAATSTGASGTTGN